jgi:hypothetical protein
MGARILRSAGAAAAAAGLTLLSFAAASHANTQALSASTPSSARAAPMRPLAAASRGWHQLLKIRSANLYTIAAVPRNAWAGGYRVLGTGLGHPYPLLEHWSDGAWHAVDLPMRLRTRDGTIDMVAASSPANVWIFITHAGKSLVSRWNGHRWQIEAPAGFPPAGTALTAATTLGAADTWEFSGFLAEHFTASGWHWSQLAISVSGVSASSRGDLWAFGSDYASQLPVAGHWNGHRWAYTRVPRGALPTGFNQLSPGGIHTFGPSNVWAVATALTSKNPSLGTPVVLHWNGRTWRRAYTGPAGHFGSLSLITADGRGDLWMTSPFIVGKHMLLHEHCGRFTWIAGPVLSNDAFFASDLAWLPGTSTLLVTGYLASEVGESYGHVESYTF